MAGLEEQPIPPVTVHQSRRWKVLTIGLGELVDLVLGSRCKSGDELIQVVNCDLPLGTRVISTKSNVIEMAMDFLLYNPAWPEVPKGEQAPRLEVRYWAHRINPSEYLELKSKKRAVFECPACMGSSEKNCETCGGKREVVALVLGPAE